MGKYKPKFFPFSPGIPWRIERGKYIKPEIDSVIWHRVLDGKDITITAFGGLFESFFSLCAVEALKSFDPKHKIFWKGNEEFEFFYRAQGLCKVSNVNLTSETLNSYPTPIFFDANGGAYFNLLNNYLVRKSYWGKYPEKVDAPGTAQIFRNVMVPWQGYIPKMRALGNEFMKELKSTALIRDHSRIITVICNEKNDGLNWDVQNIKEFAQLAHNSGLKVVVFSNNTRLFYGTNAKAFDYDIRKIMQLIPNSWMVLSTDIQWNLISMMISKAHIISEHVDGHLELFKNAEFLECTNDIFTEREWVSPISAHNICKGLL